MSSVLDHSDTSSIVLLRVCFKFCENSKLCWICVCIHVTIVVSQSNMCRVWMNTYVHVKYIYVTWQHYELQFYSRTVRGYNLKTHLVVKPERFIEFFCELYFWVVLIKKTDLLFCSTWIRPWILVKFMSCVVRYDFLAFVSSLFPYILQGVHISF